MGARLPAGTAQKGQEKRTLSDGRFSVFSREKRLKPSSHRRPPQSGVYARVSLAVGRRVSARFSERRAGMSVFGAERRKFVRQPGRLNPIDPRQQPTKLAANHGSIAEGTDAGDVDVNRRATVRTRLRGDVPRPAGLRERRALKKPIFGPVPGFGDAADHIPAGVDVVVGGVGVDADRDG